MYVFLYCIIHAKNDDAYLYKYWQMIFCTKSIISKVQWLSCLVFIVLSHFDAVYGQVATTTTTTTTTPRNKCGLNDRFTFGLSVSYACVSILLLLCVSYWSFKSMSGLYIFKANTLSA